MPAMNEDETVAGMPTVAMWRLELSSATGFDSRFDEIALRYSWWP